VGVECDSNIADRRPVRSSVRAKAALPMNRSQVTDLDNAVRPPRKASWLRFTVRTLCIAVMLISVVFACLGSRIRQGERQRALINAVEYVGGEVLFADERTVDGYGDVYSPRQRSWDQSVFGNCYSRKIYYISLPDADAIDPDLLSKLAYFPELTAITVSPAVAGMPGLRQFKKSNPNLKIHVAWALRHAPEVSTVTSIHEFEKALHDGRSVLFIDGDWSLVSAASRPVYSEFAHTWRPAPDDPPMHFIRLDFSTSNTPLWHHVQKWLDAESVERGGYKNFGGVGKVLWVQDGHVKDWATHVGGLNCEDMIARTRKAFAKSTMPRQ
jgi:hypothetical protein